MESFHEAIALRSSDFGFSVFNALELEEELIGVPIGFSTVLAAVITENGFDLDTMFFAEGQDIFIEQVNGSYGQLGSVQASPGVAGVAVDG